MMLHNTWAVFRFELRRTLTLSRLGVWLMLVLFPVFIISVINYYEDELQFADGGVGRRNETITCNGGARIDITYRHGRRVAEIHFPPEHNRPNISGVLIPNHLSKEEIKQSYLELAADRSHRDRRTWSEDRLDDTVWGWILLGLIPGVTTLLGLLLWVTPLVQSELEGKTWVYLAVHPRGRASLLLGKYFTAIAWTAAAGWTSVTICILIAQPVYALRLWGSLVLMIGFACFGYGALYSLIGVFVQRRAMVIAVAYTLILEFLVSFVPAVINQFTVLFRLRNLFVRFMQWRPLFAGGASDVFISDQPAWLHILILCGYTAALLTVSLQVIQHKEYITEHEV